MVPCLPLRHRMISACRDNYLGNIGYLFVYNSLVFRVPLWVKEAYAPAMIRVERALSPFQSRRLSCFCVSQWQKR